MKKLKFFINYDNEETWLNRLAQDGQLLSRRRLFYTFEPAKPGSAVVRVDYRAKMMRADFDDYITLFEDAGWEHRAGSRHGGSQYFAKRFSGPASSSPEKDAAANDIFSDAESKALRYRRSINRRSVALYLFALQSFITLFVNGNFSLEHLTHLQDFYLTPGLWDLTGVEFVLRFAFETPLVLTFELFPLLIVACTPVLLAQVILQYRLLKKVDKSKQDPFIQKRERTS